MAFPLQSPNPRRFHRSVRAEELTQLLGIELGLLERREVPPTRGLVTRTTFAVLSSHARGGRTMSPGKREKPDGTSTRRACCAAGIAAFTPYMRIGRTDRAREPVDHDIGEGISSFEKHRSMSPAQSLHERSFSTIHAASPAGESVSPTAAV